MRSTLNAILMGIVLSVACWLTFTPADDGGLVSVLPRLQKLEPIPDPGPTPSVATENGDTPLPAPLPPGSEGATSEPPATITEPVDVSQFVHRINTRTGRDAFDGGQGSCTHVGRGVYLTCRHVFDRPVSSVEIDGQPVAATWSWSTDLDFAVLRTESDGGEFATVSTSELSDGQPLRAYGQKTGPHEGTLSDKRWSPGYRAVTCAVPTESGDSGAGVFNAAGELVGVHWGSTGNDVFFTPLSTVESLVAPLVARAAIAAHPRTAPPAANREWSEAAGDVTFWSPESWHCEFCGPFVAQDWSTAPYRTRTKESDDIEEKLREWGYRGEFGGWPVTTWRGSNGRLQVLFGAYKPWQVTASWEQTR
jgi:hypothetical protein